MIFPQALRRGAAAMAWKRLVAAERSAWRMRIDYHAGKKSIEILHHLGWLKHIETLWDMINIDKPSTGAGFRIHSIGCGLQCRKRIWIATRWSGRVEQNEQRSFAILKWILSRIKRNMDRLCVPSGSGSYILSCSHISDCVISHNIHLS